MDSSTSRPPLRPREGSNSMQRSMSSSSLDEDRDPPALTSEQLVRNRESFRENLRIELPPPPASSDYPPSSASPIAPVETAPCTATVVPAGSAFTPSLMDLYTDTAHVNYGIQRSALAFLQSESRTRGNLSLSARSLAASMRVATAPAVDEMALPAAEPAKKKMSSLSAFGNRLRKGLMPPSASTPQPAPLTRDGTSRTNEDISEEEGGQRAGLQNSLPTNAADEAAQLSDTGEHENRDLLSPSEVALESSVRQDRVAEHGRKSSHAMPGREPSETMSPRLPLGESPPHADLEEDSSESTEGAVGIDLVLRDASKIRGLRLTWMIYGMVLFVIVLFVALLIQIAYGTNHTLTKTATQAVQTQAASLLNNMELVQFGLTDLFHLLITLDVWELTGKGEQYDVVRESLCTRFSRAPMAFAVFDVNGTQQWSIVCKRYDSHGLPDAIPHTLDPFTDAVKLVDYGQESILAYHTLSNSTGSFSTMLVMLEKDVLGRYLMANELPNYSTGTLQNTYAAYFISNQEGTGETLMLHTLTRDTPVYSMEQPTALGSSLTDTFNTYCHPGSQFVWHTVVRPSLAWNDAEMESSDKSTWINTTTNPIPRPVFFYKGAWSLLSRSILCGVLCISDKGDTCGAENPTNAWFVVDFRMYEQDQESTVTVLGAVSIVAVVLFSITLLLVYIGIAVPVNYLKYQLLHTADTKEKPSRWEKNVVRWTHRLWLGDLTAIVRSTHILSLCYRLTKKYVPEHVTRNHAKELYLRRKTYNFLNVVEMQDNNADGAASGSDSDDEELSTAPGVAAPSTAGGMPSPGGHVALHIPDGDFCVAVAGTGPEPVSGGRRTLGTPLSTSKAAETAFPGTYTDLDAALYDAEMSFVMGPVPDRKKVHSMVIRRDSEATILCVRTPDIETAYLMDYSTAAVQHTRLMRYILNRIRRNKGVLYHRSGDCIGAAWNAFEACPSHAEYAAVCAQEIANMFASFKAEGFRIGIVLHQSNMVCGTVEYSKTAFVTAFGEGPRQARSIAELAATQKSFDVVVTEPVKQALAASYECNIIDVIRVPESPHPLILFQLCGMRTPQPSPRKSYPRSPQYSAYAIEYAKVFSQFRNGEFADAISGVQRLREKFPGKGEHLVDRLEMLSKFFSHRPRILPMPYQRPFPFWINYESMAREAAPSSECCPPPRRASGGSHSDTPNSAVAPVYQKLPAFVDDKEYIRNFRQELQDNLRRLGTPAVHSPHLSSRKSGSPTGVDGSAAMVALPTPLSSASVAPVVAADVLTLEGCDTSIAEDQSSVSLHLDPHHMPVTELPLPLPVTVVPALQPIIMPNMALKEEGPLPGVARHSGGSSPREATSTSERFSATHNFTSRPPIALGDSPEMHGAILTVGSAPSQNSLTQLGSLNEGNNASYIQSVGLSVHENAVSFSASVAQQNIPVEVMAQNGTTYLRSTRVLGRGSFGCVYLGMDVHSGKLVAIKFLPMPSDDDGIAVVEAEVQIMQHVKDQHVVEFISYAFQGDMIVLVMECMLAGSLQNMISAFRSIPSSTARVFMRDVLRGLSKLHSVGVVHRDVKPQNVLLSLSGTCKISDFGASAWLQELARKDSAARVMGTPVYLAPEAARGNPSKECDVWSCGIMYLQMITGHLPYTPDQLALGAAALVFQIGSCIAVPIIPDNLDQLDVEFVESCLQRDPASRLSAEQLLQLPLFTV